MGAVNYFLSAGASSERIEWHFIGRAKQCIVFKQHHLASDFSGQIPPLMQGVKSGLQQLQDKSNERSFSDDDRELETRN